MNILILDNCKFTQLGMNQCLSELGIPDENVSFFSCIKQLNDDFMEILPDIVFLSEDYFYTEYGHNQHLKELISKYPNTLFCIFISISNTNYDDFLYIRHNVIITSKAIKVDTFEKLLKNKSYGNNRKLASKVIRPLTLSKTESDMLKMWMDGINTRIMCDRMQIKPKTISSHKGNIKRKIKTHNKQVIYHVVKLTEDLTSGIYVNMGQSS